MRTALVTQAMALAVAMTASPATAQDAETSEWKGTVAPVSGFTGQMSMTMEGEIPDGMAVEEVVRFEPWQVLNDLFRDDLVFLMRSGPSDWTARDQSMNGAQDCGNQRLLSSTGEDRIRQFGAQMVVHELRPGAVLMSEWCRAQQTYLALETGMLGVDMKALDGMTTQLDPTLNLLNAPHGASDVAALQQTILDWDGSDGDGPLLIITHFDNIAALTRFNVYEGEVLIVDPTRDGRVLGYLRLGSATPDPIRYSQEAVDYAQAQAALAETRQ